MFTADELEWVRSVTLWDVIVNSTDVKPDSLQREVFFWNDGDPCPQPGQIEPSTLEPCSYLKGFDYFEVSNTLRTWANLCSPLFVLLRTQGRPEIPQSLGQNKNIFTLAHVFILLIHSFWKSMSLTKVMSEKRLSVVR